MTNKQRKKISLDRLRHISEQKFDIRISTDGRWFHEGDEICRITLVKMFASILLRDEIGEYWLATPVEKGRITVDDVPFIISKMIVTGDVNLKSTKIEFLTNLGHKVSLDAAHPLQLFVAQNTQDLRPYIEVQDGLLAKLSRPVYYELSEYAEHGPSGKLGVWSHKQFFDLEL